MIKLVCCYSADFQFLDLKPTLTPPLSRPTGEGWGEGFVQCAVRLLSTIITARYRQHFAAAAAVFLADNSRLVT